MDPLQLEAVLTRFGPAWQAVRIATPAAAGFSGAVIRQMTCQDGRYCLRGWPRNSLPIERIAGLHRLLDWISRRGVRQVAVPIRDGEGVTLVEHHGRFWQIEPWMPGSADFSSNPSVSRLRSAMACLAAWHNASRSFAPHQSEAKWFYQASNTPSPAVHERIQRLREWKTRGLRADSTLIPGNSPVDYRAVATHTIDLAAQAAHRVSADLESASRIPLSLQPCLRDIWHDHVLFTGDEVTGLIDASACRSENIATDLARLLGSFAGDDGKLWETAIGNYHAHRPLSDNERLLVRVLDDSGTLLSALAWIDRGHRFGPTIMESPRVLERMRRLATRLEHLADR